MTTSQQLGQDEYTAGDRFDELPSHRRRRLLTIFAIRSLGSVVVLLAAYFLLPFTRLLNGKLIAEFAAGSSACDRCSDGADISDAAFSLSTTALG